MKNRDGFVMPIAFFLASAIAIVAMVLYTLASTYAPLLQTMIKREKARMIALGGIEIARAQLAQAFIEKKEDQKNERAAKEEVNKQSPQDKQAMKFLSYFLPLLNQWQKYSLVFEDNKAVGSISLCITSEEGKIDLNAIYDFKKHDFKGHGTSSWRPIVQALCEKLQIAVGGENLFTALDRFLKRRRYPLNDITELLSEKEFKAFGNRIFLEPSPDEKRQFFLTDLFTVHSGKATIDPWLFSGSIITVLGFPKSENKEKESIQARLKGFRTFARWPQDWAIRMTPRYAVQLQSLPKGVEFVLSMFFDPRHFLIISYGTYAQVTQKLAAVLERRPLKQEPSQQESSEADVAHDIVVKRVYWL